MKKLMRLLIATTVLTSLVACCSSTKMILRMSNSERTDVFTEVPAAGGTVPSGYADVVIKASLKTPIAGYYLLESKGYQQGKAVYSFLINIDGQAALWQVEGRKHELPEYVDDKTSRDPEAGEGMKYVLEKKVRLAAGHHKVFFGLPSEPYYTTVDIFVKSGGLYDLEFKPEYRHKTGPTRIPTFLKGVDKFDAIVKEITVKDY